MSVSDTIVDAITDYSKLAIAVMLVLTMVIGAGAAQVSQTSSLDQFQSETPEADDLDYIETHFSTGSANTTTAQVIVRGDNVLSKSALLETLRYQQQIRTDPAIGETLAQERATVGIANAIATAAIKQERGQALQATAQEFQRVNETVQEQRAALEAERTRLAKNRTEFNETKAAVTARATEVNATADALKAGLQTIQQEPTASIRDQFDAVAASASVELNETDYATFETAAKQLRNTTDPAAIEEAYQLGTRGVLAAEYTALAEQQERLETWGAQLQQRGAALQEQAAQLSERGEQLRDLGTELQQTRAAFENATAATLTQQIDQLESMNASAIEETVGLVLGADGNSPSRALTFMSTNYDQGSRSAQATMLLVTQQTETALPPGGTAPEAITDAQLALQDLGADFQQEYLVFGSGIITDEINRSMTDSMLIVGPLALLFVLLALAIGYRDILDIILGVFGIGAVLVWTFGFMGWASIEFNQIFIAVPVLLIGLSIDYAIHIFMRHREERTAGDELGPRESMRTALAGVGVALTLVTATTVIGFLSNVTSPVPPIQEFGVVSSVGIVAALLIFGVLVPALKVELDEFLEGRGFDRHKRAIGTGGGRLSQVLKIGSVGARKAPYAVIVFALLLSAAGAYGGSQVDTTFAQEDFLAEDPPGWMEQLPEPFKPGDYTAKQNLNYVNDRFIREDSQAQLLIRGDLATPDAIERLDQARSEMAGKNVTQKLSSGEPDVQSPLSVMETVAAQNETFNATFQAADANGDGVPETNVSAVYETLFEVAPDQAGAVLSKNGDEYEAARIVVSIQGGASSSAVTEEMRAVADSLSGSGIEATATGQTILFEIIQDQLLETVIQSLLITLVAVFAFLMVVYRISDGSATLGFVTLLPVVFSVAWILGTMYLLDIPFNVMTGMITSLTVGLGVAYSIHLSERYNQELERADSVWEALDRSVTGTGGALLGSAATTVGGFGVLVFAILPPLQQFGLITGLTIIYAFLAAVLVLPSLLVVWTRLFGPEWTFSADEPDDDTDSSSADTDASTANTRAVDQQVDATPISAERSVKPTRVTPGDGVTVTVRIEGVSGRLAVRDGFDGAGIALRTASPAPAEFAVSDSTAVLVWEDPEAPIEVEYDATIAGDASDGSTLQFDGVVLTSGPDVAIDGEDSVTVVSDLFDLVRSEGQISQGELRLATGHVADGRLSESEFERLCRLWIEDER
ncbi:Patched family protein [Halorhabdus sp. CBA1104]|uniref:MMPL family transporter n=1 Tax=Halorhabdus sp. CBA1104 TaxID=1380432 RepID=UPI0012B2CE71|nr:MMPL family transporter [Halorhabdus sp. CBA1104]QGN06702.1 Patched family protein [Halorhabdus sp. CBA1104]